MTATDRHGLDRHPQEQRDAHIRSADFFDVGQPPDLTFRSTGVRTDGDDWTVEGDLTIKGITKPVTLELELNGFGPDAYGGTRAGFSAKTEISRKDFGVDIDMPMDGGGVVVGDKITSSSRSRPCSAPPDSGTRTQQPPAETSGAVSSSPRVGASRERLPAVSRASHHG